MNIDPLNDKQYRLVKKGYIRALATGNEKYTVIINGESAVLLVTYAKYLIEYIENTRRQRGLPIYVLKSGGKLVKVR
jgi:hypothetical protein